MQQVGAVGKRDIVVYVTFIEKHFITRTIGPCWAQSDNGAPNDPGEAEEIAKHHKAVGSLCMPRIPCALEDKAEQAVGDLKGTYAKTYSNPKLEIIGNVDGINSIFRIL